MDIPFSRWYPVIEKRRSRRHFEAGRLIEPDKLSALDRVCQQFVPFPAARTCLATESVEDVFRGIVGSYGKIKDAPAFIAFIGNMDRPSVQEETGYTGEGVILEATALGLDTCWVAGFFNPGIVASIVGIGSNERVLAVTPVGYARRFETTEEKVLTGFGRTHRRLPASALMREPGRVLPEWIKTSVQAARLAPSAINRQPWGFGAGDDSITVYVRTGGPDFSVSKPLDCGIAMLHIEVAAMSLGVRGDWQFLKSPYVARFSRKPGT
jgi:hypothetical protein